MTTTNLSEPQEQSHEEDCTCDRCEERDKACLDAWVKAQEDWRRKQEQAQLQLTASEVEQPPMVCKRCGNYTPPVSTNSHRFGTLCQSCEDRKLREHKQAMIDHAKQWENQHDNPA